MVPFFFQVIILFALFSPSRYRVWGRSPILDTTFVQKAVQHGFHAFSHHVFTSMMWFRCSLFIVIWSVIGIFCIIPVILWGQLGMLIRGSPGDYCKIPNNSNSFWDMWFTLLYLGARLQTPMAGGWFLWYSGFFRAEGSVCGVRPAMWDLGFFPAEVLVWSRQLLAMSGSRWPRWALWFFMEMWRCWSKVNVRCCRHSVASWQRLHLFLG